MRFLVLKNITSFVLGMAVSCSSIAWCQGVQNPSPPEGAVSVSTTEEPDPFTTTNAWSRNLQVKYLNMNAESSKQIEPTFTRNPRYNLMDTLVIKICYSKLLNAKWRVTPDGDVLMSENPDDEPVKSAASPPKLPEDLLEVYSKSTEFGCEIGNKSDPELPQTSEVDPLSWLIHEHPGTSQPDDRVLKRSWHMLHNAGKGPWVVRLVRADDKLVPSPDIAKKYPWKSLDAENKLSGTYLTEAIEAVDIDPKTQTATIFLDPNILYSYLGGNAQRTPVHSGYITWTGEPAHQAVAEDKIVRLCLRTGYRLDVGLLLYGEDNKPTLIFNSANVLTNVPVSRVRKNDTIEKRLLDAQKVQLRDPFILDKVGAAKSSMLGPHGVDPNKTKPTEYAGYAAFTLLDRTAILPEVFLTSNDYVSTKSDDTSAHLGIAILNEHNVSNWRGISAPYAVLGRTFRYQALESMTQRTSSTDVYFKMGWFALPKDKKKNLPVKVSEIEAAPLLQIGFFDDFVDRRDDRLFAVTNSSECNVAGIQAVYSVNKVPITPTGDLYMKATGWGLPLAHQKGGYTAKDCLGAIKIGIKFKIPKSRTLEISYTTGADRDAGFINEPGKWDFNVTGGF